MNMMTSKPQNGALTLKELLSLADNDVELLLSCRFIGKNGKPYYSRRLIMIRLAEKERRQKALEKALGAAPVESPVLEKKAGFIAFLRGLFGCRP